MDEYTEVYFLDDDDVRNAPRRPSTDHRSPSRPGRVFVGSAPPVRPRPAVVARPAARVVEAQPQTYAPARSGVFSNVTTGQLVELASMVIAAIMPLPAAPVVQGEPKTDMTNQLAYTSALALHAKRDEQLRTVGALVGKLVG